MAEGRRRWIDLEVPGTGPAGSRGAPLGLEALSTIDPVLVAEIRLPRDGVHPPTLADEGFDPLVHRVPEILGAPTWLDARSSAAVALATRPPGLCLTWLDRGARRLGKGVGQRLHQVGAAARERRGREDRHQFVPGEWTLLAGRELETSTRNVEVDRGMLRAAATEPHHPRQVPEVVPEVGSTVPPLEE